MPLLGGLLVFLGCAMALDGRLGFLGLLDPGCWIFPAYLIFWLVQRLRARS